LNFSLAQQATAVTDICRRFWGMPLAIELAAAWARAIPCQEIARQIADNLAALESSAPQCARPPSQYDGRFRPFLATAAAGGTTVGRRLAVFQGGFSAAAAGKVAPPPGAISPAWPIKRCCG
jgi:predicted ATPase